MNGNSYGAGYSAPTSRGMGAILIMGIKPTDGGGEDREVLRCVLTKKDKGMLVSSLFATFHDFDGDHQQELDDND